ncbi:glycosyltransferase family 2 protein [Okibacterium endophyticum]
MRGRRAPGSTGSRRWSAEWALPVRRVVPAIDVLIPTAGRRSELAVTLGGLAAQNDPPFRVVISDQSDDGIVSAEPSIQAMIRALRAEGRDVVELRHLPRRGLAEHRQFLLEQSSAEQVLFLDDDVWLEPGALERMSVALDELGCGLVGNAVQGLSYLDDDRPHEREQFSPWAGAVEPEIIGRSALEFERWRLHNAANLAHEAAHHDLAPGEWMAYRIAWVGACVLYRRSALIECGGFGFWRELPHGHVGEDVTAQWNVMARFGGAGILPSGAVHLETPTTVTTREVDAFDVVGSPGDE